MSARINLLLLPRMLTNRHLSLPGGRHGGPAVSTELSTGLRMRNHTREQMEERESKCTYLVRMAVRAEIRHVLAT
jgi:hypothetical protein